MNQLRQTISELNLKESNSKYDTLLDIIKTNRKQIASNHQYLSIGGSVESNTKLPPHSSSKNLSNTSDTPLGDFLLHKSFKPSKQFYRFCVQFIELCYKYSSSSHHNNQKDNLANKTHSGYGSQSESLLPILYQIVPNLLSKYIQRHEETFHDLELCVKIFYNNEYEQFNKNLISKQLLLSKSGDIATLYKEHLHHHMKTTPIPPHLNELPMKNPSEELSQQQKLAIKCVMLFNIHLNMSILCEKSLIAFLWCVYVYCGGQQQQQQTGVNLYLLEKKNIFSIFKYYISIEEMSIILQTLYQMSMQRKKNKFELLSAINMIHKKAANESLFKLSEVAQSIIHLLEDEYGDAFE